MVRDRLRVMEQRINSSKNLSDEEKVMSHPDPVESNIMVIPSLCSVTKNIWLMSREKAPLGISHVVDTSHLL